MNYEEIENKEGGKAAKGWQFWNGISNQSRDFGHRIGNRHVKGAAAFTGLVMTKVRVLPQ